ncbi:hypothetical protein [Corallococcus exiguus]|uniref:hypothetical protein n=1 Tax=Corallococcus exiguus TaxID=83462 RepID=UPI002015E963|nr:hypothetical protein [Corallococcus exiguus]
MEMLLTGLMLAASPVVSSPIHSGVVAASGGVEIRSLIVLGADVDRGLVGLKVVTTAKAYEQTDNSTGASEHVKPTNCLYAGMNKTPFDGVMLALLRSGAKDPDEWEVYAAALDGSYNGARCTPPAVSKERLAQAKAAFAKASLPMGAWSALMQMPPCGRLQE